MSLCSKPINFTPVNSCDPSGGGINAVTIFSATDSLSFETFPEASNFTTDYTYDVTTQQGLNVSTITLNFVDANAVNQAGIQKLKGQALRMVVYMNDGSCRIFTGTTPTTKVWLTGLKASSGQKLEDAIEYTLVFTHRSPNEPLISQPNLVASANLIPPTTGWPNYSASSKVTLTISTNLNTYEIEETPSSQSAQVPVSISFNETITGIGDCHYGSTALSVDSWSIDTNHVLSINIVEYEVNEPAKKSKK